MEYTQIINECPIAKSPSSTSISAGALDPLTLETFSDGGISLAIDSMNIVRTASAAPRDAARMVLPLRHVEDGADVVHLCGRKS
jgi:hypothetical protein